MNLTPFSRAVMPAAAGIDTNTSHARVEWPIRHKVAVAWVMPASCPERVKWR